MTLTDKQELARLLALYQQEKFCPQCRAKMDGGENDGN